MWRVVGVVLLLAVLVVPARAAGEEAEAEKPMPPPLPLHTVEGTGGVLTTDTAYLCNMTDCCVRAERRGEECDRWFSNPSVAATALFFGDKYDQVYTISGVLLHRIELSYAYHRMNLGGWPTAVQRATGLKVSEHDVGLHILGARLNLVREGQGDIPWMPAVTVGARYKYNEDVWDIDDDLFGLPRLLGVTNNEGVDFTVTASKTFAGILPKPFILSAGLRSTEAAHIGLMGFTDSREVVFEGNAVFFVTDRLLLATEFRQKPDNLGRVPGLVGKEDNWWAVCLAYILSDNLTVAFGYTQLGEVMNNTENSGWGVQLKWEF